eukprot:11719408-Alexandrium_andersonii.AAC.1
MAVRPAPLHVRRRPGRAVPGVLRLPRGPAVPPPQGRAGDRRARGLRMRSGLMQGAEGARRRQ